MVSERHIAEAVFARHLLPIARRWRQAADMALSALGLSDANGWVLVHVGRTVEGIQQGALADLVDLSDASLVRRLHQLEAAGLITREQDPANRRANVVRLTGEGRAQAHRIEQAFAALRGTLLADVDDAALATANAVLARLDQRIARRRETAR